MEYTTGFTKGAMVTSEKEIDAIASETTKKALRNIRVRRLSDEWNTLNILMASTRIQASGEGPSKEQVRDRMFDVLDSFNVLYARTEAMLPVNRHPGHSTIEEPDDLELFSRLNNRLHVMDIKYSRYVESIPGI